MYLWGVGVAVRVLGKGAAGMCCSARCIVLCGYTHMYTHT
jgi:hypothetical protein